MSWGDLAGNQAVSGANLISAGSLFTVKPGKTIPSTNKCLTRDEAFSLINIEPISGNKLVLKNELIPKPVYTDIGAPDNAFMICNNENFIFISDPNNHRVIKYPINGGKGVVIAGNGIAGSGNYQLNSPLGIDIVNDFLIIADSKNNRIVYCSASGTPGSNQLFDQVVWPYYNPQYPVHVSGQIFSASTGIANYIVASSINDYNSLFTVTGTLNHNLYDYNNNILNTYTQSAGSRPEKQYVQFTDLDNYRIVYLANSTGIPLALRKMVPNAQFGDQNQLGFNVFVNAFLWIPFNVGTGIKKVITITSDGYLSVLSNTSNYSIEKQAALPAWMTDVKGMSAVRYPSLDSNGNPRKPIFILSGNRVGKWMNDVFTEISIGQNPSYFLVSSEIFTGYNSISEVCSLNTSEYGMAWYTLNANGRLEVGDFVYYYFEGNYYPVFYTDASYYSYFESGVKVWVNIDLNGAVSAKGVCGGVKNFSVYQSGRRLVLSADDGVISANLNLDIYYTITDQSGNTSSPAIRLITLNAGENSVNTTNITGSPGDTIDIVNINFTPSSSDGYTLYVNGYAGNDGIE